VKGRELVKEGGGRETHPAVNRKLQEGVVCPSSFSLGGRKKKKKVKKGGGGGVGFSAFPILLGGLGKKKRKVLRRGG